MGSVIIFMPKYDDANKIAGLIKSHGMQHEVSICETGADILRTANDRDYGVVICTKNMKDMGYADLAEMLPHNFGMIIMTKDASLDIFRDDMVRLILPFKTRDLLDTIEMIMQNFYRSVKKNKVPPKRSDEDKKLLEAAKSILMERNGMSEPEAFRYIQKNSMDYGRKMTESAMMILTLYGE